MNVPFIDLKHQTKLIDHDERNFIFSFFDEMEFIGNKSSRDLAREITKKCGFGGQFVPCANGTDALELALMGHGLRDGKKIACPEITFWASCEVIINAANIPVLLDIDNSDLQLSFDCIVEAHEAFKLDAIILPHLFGWCSTRLREIREFCKAEGIIVVEDGAQSFGVHLEDEAVVTNAQISTVSFYPAKVLGGCMDGGGVFCADEEMALRITQLSNHGRSEHYGYEYSGINSRMAGVQARYLLKMLNHIDFIIDERIRILKQYHENLSQFSHDLTLHSPPDDISGNGYLLVATENSGRIAELTQYLKTRGIGFGRVYPSLMSNQKANFEFLSLRQARQAQLFADRVINLPLYFGMDEASINYVTSSVREFYNG
jgi:UDP-2-acetamido-2-deoxy-ribo-hexuluronate aminotransferase